MKEPIYVSFYTPDYAEQAARLRASLEHWNLRCDIAAVGDAGTWVKNCAQKPHFILKQLQAYRSPVVWVDADAEIVQRPDFARMYPPQTDVARCKYKWWNGKIEVLSGTLYFGATVGAARLLCEWTEVCKLRPDMWDQHALEIALDSTSGLEVFELPVEYCFINDLHREQHLNAEAVIVHYQHSRVTRMKGL